MSTTDTDPDGPSLFDADTETLPAQEEAVEEQARARREAADALLQKFTKPRPPAPTPKQRAESNGDPFVAYSAVHSPAVSANPHITTPGIRVEGLAHSFEHETVELPPAEEATAVLTARPARRYVLLGSLLALLVVVVLTVANLVLRSSNPSVDAIATVPPRPSETAMAPKLDIPPPPAPTASSSPPPLAPITVPTSPSPSTVTRTLPAAPRERPITPSLTTKIPEDP